MSEKYLIFGATGSIGSSLAEQLKNSGNDIHLVARNETEVGSIAEKLGCTFTVTDVLEDNFIEKVKSDITEIKGIAYCVGSIDLKPLRMVTEQDFLFVMFFISAQSIIFRHKKYMVLFEAVEVF